MTSRRFRLPHPVLFAVLGMVVGVVLAGLAVKDRNDDRTLADRGRETTARVVDVTERAWPRNPRATVEFTADGRTARGPITVDRDRTPRVGEEVPVRFDPRHPGESVIDARRAGGSSTVAYLAVAALFLFGAPAVAWFLIRPARRALAGNPALAERVEQAHRAAERR